MVTARLAVLVLTLVCAGATLAQSSASGRDDALKALASQDAAQRAQGLAWIAEHGTQADTALLERRLTDDDPDVRSVAEQSLWVLWSRSGDPAVDALLAKGVEQMQAQQLADAIDTFSEVIRLRPAFAEGWNKRATALFLAGELRKSLADCDEVIKRNPRHFGALAGYGQIYFQLEQYDKAVDYWKRALQVNPNMDGVEFNIGIAERLIEERRRHSV